MEEAGESGGKMSGGGTSMDHYKDFAFFLHDGRYGRILSRGVI